MTLELLKVGLNGQIEFDFESLALKMSDDFVNYVQGILKYRTNVKFLKAELVRDELRVMMHDLNLDLKLIYTFTQYGKKDCSYQLIYLDYAKVLIEWAGDLFEA